MDFISEFQFIFCLIILFVGISGNLLVIITFCSKCARLKACEVLMINLAIGDLVGTFCQPLLIIFNVKVVDISFLGHFGCKFFSWLSTTSITVSAFSMVAISIDRFMIVLWPLRNRPRQRIIVLLAVGLWILASLVGMIYFVRVSLHPYYNHTCTVIYKSDKEDIVHTVSLFVIQMALPMIIMSVVYGIILHRLKSPARIRQLSVDGRFFEIRQRRNRKSTKLFMTICILFYVLTLPYNIFYIWYTFNYKTITNEKRIRTTFNILVLILLANSCVNPLIYSRLHKSFRNNTLRLLCPCLVKRYPKFWKRPLSFRGKSGSSSYRRSISTFTTSSSPATTPSTPRSPFPFAEQNPFGGPTLQQLQHHDCVEPLQHGATASDGKEGDSPKTVSLRVSYLKYDTAVGENRCILNGIEELPNNGGSSPASVAMVKRTPRNVRFSFNESDKQLDKYSCIDNTEILTNGSDVFVSATNPLLQN